ncbi:MAG: sensor histidine kinase [Pseudomonadota bacterium]
MTQSLTARVLLGASVWVFLAVGIGGYGVYQVFHDSAVRQFDTRLDEELELLIAAVAFHPRDPAARMTMPAFQRIYSGRYWQATQPDMVFRSRSLQGFPLPSSDGTAPGKGNSPGPDGQTLRVVSKTVTTPGGADWHLSVAADTDLLEEEQAIIQRSLLMAAGLLMFVLTSAAFLLLRTALAPLSSVRHAVRALKYETGAHDPDSFPTEIRPLIADLNDAFQKNVRLRERGEVQAANLAHTLKTPAAILQNEISRVADGAQLDVPIARAAVDQISTTADAHLLAALTRQENAVNDAVIDGANSLRNLVSATSRLFPDIRLRVEAPDRLEMQIAETAFQEILGNLVENAGKWAQREIVVKLKQDEDQVVLQVEDDGPGVPKEKREKILIQHVRLDEAKPGVGLGLSIVLGILERIGGSISLDKSALGGLAAEVKFPHVLRET